MSDTNYTWAARRAGFFTLALVVLGAVLFLIGYNMAAFIPAIVPGNSFDNSLYTVRDVWNNDRLLALPGLFTKLVTIVIYSIGWGIYTKVISGDTTFGNLLRTFRSQSFNDSPGITYMGGTTMIVLFVLACVPFTALPNYLALLLIKTGLFILVSMGFALAINLAIGVRSFSKLVEFFDDPNSGNEAWAIVFSMVCGVAFVYFQF